MSQCWLTESPSNRKPQAATAQWSSIQTTLGQADSDVLILLDCCAAASSAGSPSEGHTEIIGACGFESYAPGVGHHSFTRSLIEELRYYGQLRRPVSTAFLFSKILARAKFSWNPRFERDAYSERRRTPFHIHLADISKQRCIQLTPMAPLSPPSGHAPGLHTSPSQSSSAEQSSVTSTSPSEDVDMSDPAASDPSQSSETSFESQQLQPRVLISVALEQAQILRTEDWIDWLKSFPALARWIHLESAYVSDSGLLLISLPVVVWDMLPRHPAISFISFVRSRNLLTSKDRPAGHQGTKLELLDILRADSSREKDLFYPAEMPSQWLRLENDLGWSSHFKTKQTKRKTSSERLATTFFRSEPQKKIPMAVHLPTGALITCIAHVDTAMDADVISSSLVEYLGLSKEKCKGDPVWNSPGLSREDYVGHPALMDIYTVQPPWQTTFDWHFLKFDKTFTTTFVVLDQDTSEGPDLVLGMQSIEALKFYHENNKVW